VRSCSSRARKRRPSIFTVGVSTECTLIVVVVHGDYYLPPVKSSSVRGYQHCALLPCLLSLWLAERSRDSECLGHILGVGEGGKGDFALSSDFGQEGGDVVIVLVESFVPVELGVGHGAVDEVVFAVAVGGVVEAWIGGRRV
jgi:hypothetical protein